LDRPVHIRICPVCRKELLPESREIFCSEKCRVIDLSRWLNEEYRIRSGEAEEEGSVIHSLGQELPAPPEEES
jgi:hypothetical protein